MGEAVPGAIFRWAAPLFAHQARRWSTDDAAAIGRFLQGFVIPGGSILDVGGGTGQLASLLASETDCTVTILDSSPQMLERARSRVGVVPILGDAASMPIADGSFDAVVVCDAFHHFVRRDEAAEEMARVVRRGGAILVVEMDPRPLSARMTAAVERMLGEPGNFMSPQDMEALFNRLGVKGQAVPQGKTSYLFLGTRT